MTSVYDLSNLSSEEGFIIQGDVTATDRAGSSVSSAGDVNGDGIDDMIVGAPGDDTGGGWAGAAYVIYGRDVAGGASAFDGLDLSALDPTDGFVIQGGAGDLAGTSVSGAGDVNGDGIDDLIVGAPRGYFSDTWAGSAYVIFGRDVAGGADAFGTIDLTALDPADGFSMQGYAWGDDYGEGDAAGTSVSAAGDVNGDGIADMIVGAPSGNLGGLYAGEAYVVFGRDVAGGATAFGPIDLSTLDPADGFMIQGILQGNYIGTSVSNAGDVNGDGIDDLIVGAENGGNYGHGRGEAYVIYGRDVAGGAEAFADIDLGALDPADGFLIHGVYGDLAGYSVSAAGDVNGDGIADLIVGAPRGSRAGLLAGEAYVIFGRDVGGGAATFGTIDLSALDPADGFMILADSDRDLAGYSVSGAGDVNGDGIDDVIVGAAFGEDGGEDAGEAYVIYGRDVPGGATAFATVDLSDLDPADGFILQGDAPGDSLGLSVSDVGDINGDGHDDMIVGTYLGDNGGWRPGEAYVIYGKPPRVDLRGDAGANTLTGDVNDDVLRGVGGDDLLDGGLGNDLLRGGAGDDELYGGAGADELFGNAGDDTLYGGLGNDRLDGRAGDDLLDGGEGDDYLRGNYGSDRLIGGAGDDRLWGGVGQDLLEGGAGNDKFVFAAVANTAAGTGDTIADFETGDVIYLGRIDADATTAATHEVFIWRADAAFTNTASELRYEVSGTDALLQGDIDGDGLADLEITLTGVTALTEADFAGKPLRLNLRGDASANSLAGKTGDDILRGVAGDDVLVGNAGSDLLRGGAGDDDLSGGVGADEMYGNKGDDTLFGGSDNDILYGGAGNDLLQGWNGNDLLRGGPGDDRLEGYYGDNRLFGNKGNDTLVGGGSDDTLDGGWDDDVLDGGWGRDALKGNAGDDTIYGGSDHDRITGGLGQDYLEGGRDKDRFIYGSVEHSRPDAPDTIADFEAPDLILLDRIDADATSAASNEAFTWVGEAAFTGVAGELRYEVSGADALLQGDVDGDGVADLEIILLGVSALSATDFAL